LTYFPGPCLGPSLVVCLSQRTQCLFASELARDHLRLRPNFSL